MKNHKNRMSRAKTNIIFVSLLVMSVALSAQTYPIVGTNQSKFFNNSAVITAPSSGQAFYGQNAQYPGTAPSYTNNGNGTITDNVTGLIWQMDADLNGDGLINVNDKFTYHGALVYADTLTLAGHNDWRVPTIKELYSLILFSGVDISAPNPSVFIPFLDTNYFNFGYGDLGAGERLIDAQYASSTLYVSTTMSGQPTMFGVNFADGRIKGYGLYNPMGDSTDFYVKCVRGPATYGTNNFTDNGDSTVTDNATGLMWTKYDNGQAILWENALSYAENLNLAGYSDWRLPDAKELQSIIDYTRSPATTSSAAIDPLFHCTQITDEGGDPNYPFYWASTTHENLGTAPGMAAVYVCFGEALGWMEQPPTSGNYVLMDVHGAGAQRSDFKTGDPANYPHGHGPQGDVVRIYNYVRVVRNAVGSGTGEIQKPENHYYIFPNPASDIITIQAANNTSGDYKIEIFDVAGRSIYQQTTRGTQHIDVSGFGSGIYVVRCTAGGHSSRIKFAVK